jgi:hypothetical protein
MGYEFRRLDESKRLLEGNTNQGTWCLTSDDPIQIGTSEIEFTADLSLDNLSSTLVSHVGNGTGATTMTVQNALELDAVSIFKFMTEVERNDVMGLVGSVNVSSAVQKALDYAEVTQRPITGWGRVRLENTLNPYTSIWGIGGGQFQGAGLRFVWMGTDDKVMAILGEDIQGLSFRNFRIDCQFVTTPAAMMWFEQGLHGGVFDELCFRGYHTGSFGGGTYAEHDGIVFVGGDGTTSKYDVSQNKISRIEFVRTRNCITVTDSVPTGEAPGNSNTISEIIAICNGHVFKSPGSNNRFQNCEVYVDSGSGGHAFVMDGGNAFGWTFDNLDADGYAGTAGWEPIHANTAGAVNLFTWDGGILWPRGGNVPAPVLDAGATGGKVVRYGIFNVNNVESTTHYTDTVKTASSLTTYNRGSPDGVMIDFAGSANFIGEGLMTVTGVSIAPAQYEISNKMMSVYIRGSATVGGTPGARIYFTIPGSKVAGINSPNMPISIYNNSTWSTGVATVSSSGTTVDCYINGSKSAAWTAGAIEIQAMIRFPIQ